MFKKGDKVVVARIKFVDDLPEYKKFIGKTVTIVEDDKEIPKCLTEFGYALFYKEELVLKEIYNTPLYHVMSENEEET